MENLGKYREICEYKGKFGKTKENLRKLGELRRKEVN
jgi:hypothetical protein